MKKCTLNTQMMLLNNPKNEVWNVGHSMCSCSFNYVTKGEGLSESDY